MLDQFRNGSVSVYEAPGVTIIAPTPGNRIAVLSGGRLSVKEGPFNATWTTMSSPDQSIALLIS